MKALIKLAAMGCAFALLCACGGGGGNTPAPPQSQDATWDQTNWDQTNWT